MASRVARVPLQRHRDHREDAATLKNAIAVWLRTAKQTTVMAAAISVVASQAWPSPTAVMIVRQVIAVLGVESDRAGVVRLQVEETCGDGGDGENRGGRGGDIQRLAVFRLVRRERERAQDEASDQAGGAQVDEHRGDGHAVADDSAGVDRDGRIRAAAIGEAREECRKRHNQQRRRPHNSRDSNHVASLSDVGWEDSAPYLHRMCGKCPPKASSAGTYCTFDERLGWVKRKRDASPKAFVPFGLAKTTLRQP